MGEHDFPEETGIHGGEIYCATGAHSDAVLMSGPVTERIVRRVHVRNKAGLHARPAGMLSVEAKKYESEIEVVLADVPADHHIQMGPRVDAKNIIELLGLGAPCGTALDLEATGGDADAAVSAIVDLFEDCFGLESG